MQESFSHTPLPHPRGYIRLLEIKKVDNSQKSPTECELTTWPFPSLEIEYHAISYTWGDPQLTTNILVNGKTFEVRQNCEFVLRQAKASGVNMYYWIDSICIDQENLDEKADQVAMMGAIYSSAKHVLACVGRHSDESAFLVRFLTEHEAIFKEASEWEGAGVIPAVCSVKLLSTLEKSTLCRALQALISFASRPYFNRVWILQELALGGDIIFCCGMDYLHIKLLYGISVMVTECVFAGGGLQPFPWAAQMYLDHDFGDWSACEKLRMHTENASHKPELMYLIDLMRDVRGLACQDPRDRVYGILSTITWGSVASIEPNYRIGRLALGVKVLQKLAELSSQKGSPDFVGLVGLVAKNLELNGSSTSSVPEDVTRALNSRRSNLPLFEMPVQLNNSMKKAFKGIWREKYIGCPLYQIDGHWYLTLPEAEEGNPDSDAEWEDISGSEDSISCGYEYSDTHANEEPPVISKNDKASPFPAPNKRAYEEFPSNTILKDDGSVECFLPSDIREGDFLLVKLPSAIEPLVGWTMAFVAREESSMRCSIIGKALRDTNCEAKVVKGLSMDVYFDPEDAMLNFGVIDPKADWKTMSSEAVAEYVDTKVCRVPGSSYALVTDVKRKAAKPIINRTVRQAVRCKRA